MTSGKNNFPVRVATSATVLLAALGLAYAPVPGLSHTVVVVSGTELQEPLQQLVAEFEQQHPSIDLDLKFQGSQELINDYIDDTYDFTPTVLIPANGEMLEELSDRWQSQNHTDPFYEEPRPIAKTLLVGIAWTDRGNTLFPTGQFQWQRVEQAMQSGNWSTIGGAPEWGSFDLVITDPTRSNSGQSTLSLFAQSKRGNTPLTATTVNTPAVETLFSLVKRSVYQPARSTDILLQEFIARGPNDADVAVVYESIALYRWQQSAINQGKPYQIYYLDVTVESISTAAIVRRGVNQSTAEAAQSFLDFLTEPEQQAVLVQHGFRPVNPAVAVQSVPDSPWNQNIPGAQITLTGQLSPALDTETAAEVIRLWQRVN